MQMSTRGVVPLASETLASLSPSLSLGYTAATLLAFLTVDLAVAALSSSHRSVRMQMLALLTAAPRVSALASTDVPAVRRALLKDMLVLRTCMAAIANMIHVRGPCAFHPFPCAGMLGCWLESEVLDHPPRWGVVA